MNEKGLWKLICETYAIRIRARGVDIRTLSRVLTSSTRTFQNPAPTLDALFRMRTHL